MPQEQMPERVWIVKILQFGADRPYAPQTRLETCGEMTYGAVEYRPASRLSALAERVERAEALLKEAQTLLNDAVKNGCLILGRCELDSRISSFLHDGKEKP